jgi:uncharacterized membrane protein
MAAPTAAPATSSRLESVDLLRGLVMVVMALDHTRDYFHFSAVHHVDPLNLALTTPWIFFTRLITHYCAPVFCFLAGTGVYLSAARGRSKRELSGFLITRGLWLVLIELTFMTWAWTFGFDIHRFAGRVIWMLGWSMVALAALIHLPVRAVAVFGLVMILGHNALDGLAPAAFGSWALLWHILHVAGPVEVGHGVVFRASYPLIPWIGVMAAGYAFGALFKLEPAHRRRWLVRLGLGLSAAFVVLRVSNVYGDLHPWTHQARPGLTLLSVLDCTKYPPSLCYLMETLGPAMLLLAWFDRGTRPWLRPLLVFGRVPMFYYLLHIPLIHALAVAMYFVRYGGGDYFYFSNAQPPADAGVSLAVVYLVWLSVVIALYPACRWFADLKRRRRDAWLTYL